jgi:hypothetical protein
MHGRVVTKALNNLQFKLTYKGGTICSLILFCYLNIVFYKGVLVLNVTLNNISFISWRSVLLVEETGVPGQNYRPTADN